MARDPKFVLEYLKQIEAIASEILSDRRDIIELNKKRDKIREASRLGKFTFKYFDFLMSPNLILLHLKLMKFHLTKLCIHLKYQYQL